MRTDAFKPFSFKPLRSSPPVYYTTGLVQLARLARVSTLREEKRSAEEELNFVLKLLKLKHGSVFEHEVLALPLYENPEKRPELPFHLGALIWHDFLLKDTRYFLTTLRGAIRLLLERGCDEECKYRLTASLSYYCPRLTEVLNFEYSPAIMDAARRAKLKLKREDGTPPGAKEIVHSGWEFDLGPLGRVKVYSPVVIDENHPAGTVFRILFEAPVFVLRQLMRHRLHIVFTEQSRRYTKVPPKFYNGEMHPAASKGFITLSREWADEAKWRYLQQIRAGVPSELARINLPFGMLSKAVCTCSGLGLLNLLALRTAKKAQPETRIIAGTVNHTINEMLNTDFVDRFKRFLPAL